MAVLFDTHCHLSDSELRPHLDKILAECENKSVHGLALISADFTSIQENREIFDEIKLKKPHFKLLRSVGIHPHSAKELFDEHRKFNDSLWNTVLEATEGAGAIGETGLDFHYNNSEPELQNIVFHKHIDLAVSSKKPLVIHCRDAAPAILKCLQRDDLKSHPTPGILHCFAEDLNFARSVLDLNFYISFSGIITFKNAESLREVVKFVPLDKILVETDSPWLAPIPFRGKSNQPAYVSAVLDKVIELRPEGAQIISEQIWQNSCRVFSA